MPTKKESGWRKWREGNPARHLACKQQNQDERVAAKTAYVEGYLSSHPCVDCGLTEVIVLEFDHVRGKTCDIRALAIGWSSVARMIEEIAKCEVRCANCHRRRHALSRIGGGLKYGSTLFRF